MGHGRAKGPGEPLRDVVEGHGFGAGEIVHLSLVVTRRGQHGGGYGRDVPGVHRRDVLIGQRDRQRPSADRAGQAEEVLHEVARPQERPPEAGVHDLGLDLGVRAANPAGGVGPDEGGSRRQLDDVPDTGPFGDVDDVALDRGHVRMLGGVEEYGVGVIEGCGDRRQVREVHSDEMRDRVLLVAAAARGAEGHAPVGELGHERPADHAGRAGNEDHSLSP